MEWLGELVQSALEFFGLSQFTIGEALLDLVWAALPVAWDLDWHHLDDYRRAIEMWFPLQYACDLLIAYCQFWSTFTSVKMILKLIPFVG